MLLTVCWPVAVVLVADADLRAAEELVLLVVAVAGRHGSLVVLAAGLVVGEELLGLAEGAALGAGAGAV